MLPAIKAQQLLAFSVGLGQFAVAAAQRFPTARVVCHFLDLYQADMARQSLVQSVENLTIVCAADITAHDNDLLALPISSRGEAELVRDVMQAGHESLCIGGRMLSSTDNPHDSWLHDEMRKIFDTVSRRQFENGVVYVGQKKTPLKKRKSFVAEFQFRHDDRLLKAVTRPGVFSHRHLDPGARHLMRAMTVAPGEQVLDIGCGCGAVGFAAAAGGARVVAVDSSARAVECARKGAQLNGFNDFAVVHSATGPSGDPATFDLALANPPYYANFRIAERFLEISHAALRSGGRVLAVTKSPKWYEVNMQRWFGEVQIDVAKGYWIVRGRKAC